MKNILYILLFITLTTTSFAGNADKEKVSHKTVAGRITDANGEAIPGAKILVPETGETFFADMDGNFKLIVKMDKDYSVTINTIGYAPLELKASRLTAFSDLSLKSL
ncbi:hypothetical protein CNR22_10790 [Sphingobacteriaceae bacterium]|nr:hypothetical protein CNR22_10790 [Sphingobacteriaceae bacterium]